MSAVVQEELSNTLQVWGCKRGLAAPVCPGEVDQCTRAYWSDSGRGTPYAPEYRGGLSDGVAEQRDAIAVLKNRGTAEHYTG